MRTRTIVAIAALIAVVALVAGPGVAGARPSSPAPSIDPTLFRAVEIALPSEGPATSITTADMANRSAGWLGPGSRVAETGDGTGMDVPRARPAVRQPSAAVGVQPRATPTPAGSAATSAGGWTFDPDISWYGPGFYGSRTACGETLTTSLVGVASLRYPCGTLITFRNPVNGRTVTAPVVDHGPYVTGRIWDMTGGLCVALSHCYTGSMYWRVAGS